MCMIPLFGIVWSPSWKPPSPKPQNLKGYRISPLRNTTSEGLILATTKPYKKITTSRCYNLCDSRYLASGATVKVRKSEVRTLSKS